MPARLVPLSAEEQESDLLSVPDAARLIGIRTDTLSVTVRLGRIRAERVGRFYVIRRRDALEYRRRRLARLAKMNQRSATSAQAA